VDGLYKVGNWRLTCALHSQGFCFERCRHLEAGTGVDSRRELEVAMASSILFLRTHELDHRKVVYRFVVVQILEYLESRNSEVC